MRRQNEKREEVADIRRKYPRAAKFLEETGMTLDEALMYTELELKKRRN